MLADPASAAAHIWALLAAACRDREAGWRTPMLGTVAADGAPRLRTVVLRAVDAESGELWLHSDRRAAKVTELLAEPRMALGFWDPGRGLQLRLDGVARLEIDAAALNAAWDRVPPASRANYATPDPPGAPLTESKPLGDGRQNFCVIQIDAWRLEWLWLGPDGHMRGEASREGSGWAGRALVP